MATNRVRSLTRVSSILKQRIADALVDVQYATAMHRIIRQADPVNGPITPMPENLLAVANKAYDMLNAEQVPMNQWGV